MKSHLRRITWVEPQFSQINRGTANFSIIKILCILKNKIPAYEEQNGFKWTLVYCLKILFYLTIEKIIHLW